MLVLVGCFACRAARASARALPASLLDGPGVAGAPLVIHEGRRAPRKAKEVSLLVEIELAAPARG